MSVEFAHFSVMLDECITALNIQPNGIYLDGTAGGAGHSCEIAKRLTSGHLYAMDQDPDALVTAKERLSGLPATVVQGNFRNAQGLLQAEDVKKLNGALLDLGVSSRQLDTPERGFSYNTDAPLDMRMSQSGPTAADFVNTWSRQQLADVLREYGEEKMAWQIAGRIEKERETAPISTTTRLAQIVASAMPPARRREKNPARQTFQALRIAVNGELDALSEGLNSIFEMLVPGGRFAILTFHSLEDRLVKQRFKQWATACTCPPEWPVCQCGGVAEARLITKKPITAAQTELEENRRSRSAKLRVIEKI
ncbi:MAG: 16S rRNA (cytosine(1402)-N(4))-methyltransferase RsmH [Oscillospiraceae bacterium]